MTDWVPCYRTLMKGRKRALPRATRFIFLELCSEAREGGGVIELAPGLSIGEAVLDIIGGNRKEVHRAVSELVAEQMIDVESRPGFILITTWDRWTLNDVTNAERQARFRARKKAELDAESNGANAVTRNAESNGIVTAPSVTKPLPDQKRVEEKREEKRRGDPSSVTGPLRGPPSGPRATRLSEDWEPSAELVDRIRRDQGVDPMPCVRPFRNHFVAMGDANKNSKKKRWDLAFENWVDRERERLPAATPTGPLEPDKAQGPLFDGTETSTPPPAMLAALDELHAKQRAAPLPGADVRWTPKPKEPTS